MGSVFLVVVFCFFSGGVFGLLFGGVFFFVVVFSLSQQCS